MCRIWGEVLGVERVGIEDNFFEVGGDSILSIQVVGRAREEGVEITPKQMFECPTVEKLGEVAGRSGRVEAEQGRVRGRVELTPIQRAFFGWGLEKREHYNQSVLVEVKGGVETRHLEGAVEGLIRQHDVLRMRYRRAGGGEWEQWCAEEEGGGGVYERRDLSGFKEEKEWRRELERAAEEVQGSLDLEGGRVVRAVEYELGGERGKRLLLVVHHLVVDGVSWRILLQDLERGYEQQARGEEVDLGAKTTSYQEWAGRLVEYGRSEEVRGELEYWREQIQEGRGELPQDYQGMGAEANAVETQERVEVWLEEEETRELLQGVPEVYHTQVNDVLLTALWRACGEWSGREQVLVDVEGHGREEVMEGVDVSRTVGWFTTIYPVVLSGGAGAIAGERETRGWDIGGALKRIKEQMRKIPRHGLGYGLLRWMSAEESVREQLDGGARAGIRFNYLGQMDQMVGKTGLLGLAGERHGRENAGENRRRYLVDVNGMVSEGRLQMQFSYSGKLHRRATVEGLAQSYVERLREIVEHCRSAEAGGYTPSDFPLANLRDQDFEQIAALLEESV